MPERETTYHCPTCDRLVYYGHECSKSAVDSLVMAWTPISTPPPSGNYVLAVHTHHLPFIAMYRDGGYYVNLNDEASPTHWMPIPAGP